METCFNWTDTDVCFASSDQRHWINIISKMALEHPEDVTVIREPQHNDGCIYVKMPVRYIHVYPPRKNAPLTDEKKAALVERLRKKTA